MEVLGYWSRRCSIGISKVILLRVISTSASSCELSASVLSRSNDLWLQRASFGFRALDKD